MNRELRETKGKTGFDRLSGPLRLLFKNTGLLRSKFASKPKIMRVLIIFLVGLSAMGLAQQATIPFLEQVVTVDGAFDENAWENLPEYTGFYNYLPTDEGLAKNQTSVKMFHNGTHLYIAATYQDSVARTQISSLKRDDIGNTVAASDTFVLILDTQYQQQSAYYFAVNIGAAQTDGLIERIGDADGYGINTSWNAVWTANTSVDGHQKRYEIEIPLKSLNYNQNNPVFGAQFYMRDIKNNSWTIFKNVKRNFRLYDLRFTQAFAVENLSNSTLSRFAVTPSLTANYQEDVLENTNDTSIKPSLDVQYNLTSSLKLDATLNPDFSQIDVDQQVTNLTRFALFFPERRNFFLENADLFANLGVAGVNPFYSRRIGANSDIQFGLKLSGNLGAKTRLGILNAQSDRNDEIPSQNYGALVVEQQLSKKITTTAFLINRQATEGFNFIDEYNRVTGLNLNYKSTNNRWIGLANFGTSYNDSINGENNFYHGGIWYNTRGFSWNASVKNLGKNYLADVGFVPRLNNYDAITETVVREGYTQSAVETEMTKYYENSNTLNSYRYLFAINNTYWDEEGKVTQSSSFYNTALFFKNLSAVYANLYYDYERLKYAFDPLGNGNAIVPGIYRYAKMKVGFNSVRNTKLVYNTYVQYGQYYSGTNTSALINFNYRLQPFANFQASYEINSIDLNELGNTTFHLARFTGEVFFSNRLNWTTYVQYNTQFDNFNINSRLQWEYKPLSYLYLVVSDNYNQRLSRNNWGIALKMNYRFDF